MKNLYFLDWGLMLLNLYSYYIIGLKKKLGFILGFIGCILGIILFTFLQFSFPMIIMYIFFGYLNINNYIKWSK